MEDLGTPAQSAPPGWYPDPSTPALVRWWDGAHWTPHTSPNPEVRAGRHSRAWHTATVVVVVVLVVAGLGILAAIVLYAAAMNNWASNK